MMRYPELTASQALRKYADQLQELLPEIPPGESNAKLWGTIQQMRSDAIWQETYEECAAEVLLDLKQTVQNLTGIGFRSLDEAEPA
jgi:hypothetical protein